MVKSSYYPSLLSVNAIGDDRVSDDQAEGSNPLELMIEPEEVEDTLGLAHSTWPELVSCKRGRHSYAYYQSDFN